MSGAFVSLNLVHAEQSSASLLCLVSKGCQQNRAEAGETPKRAAGPGEVESTASSSCRRPCSRSFVRRVRLAHALRNKPLLALMMFFWLQGQPKTASRRGRKPAVSYEQAAEMAEEEGARQQQLQKALQLALRLEDALSTCKANVVRRHARTSVSKNVLSFL